MTTEDLPCGLLEHARQRDCVRSAGHDGPCHHPPGDVWDHELADVATLPPPTLACLDEGCDDYVVLAVGCVLVATLATTAALAAAAAIAAARAARVR